MCDKVPWISLENQPNEKKEDQKEVDNSLTNLEFHHRNVENILQLENFQILKDEIRYSIIAFNKNG